MKNRKTQFGTVLLWIAVGLAFVTVIGLFASLGNGGGDSGGGVVTTAPITTATPITTAPTSTAPPVTSTEPPVTTAPPVTTLPPVVEEPEKVYLNIPTADVTTYGSSSFVAGNGDQYAIDLDEGFSNKIDIPVAVEEAGLYEVRFTGAFESIVSSIRFYLRNKSVTNNIVEANKIWVNGTYSTHIFLVEGVNTLTMWQGGGDITIQKIEVAKLHDTDSILFFECGTGANVQSGGLCYIGNAVEGQLYSALEVTEAGEYKLYFIGGGSDTVNVAVVNTDTNEKLFSFDYQMYWDYFIDSPGRTPSVGLIDEGISLSLLEGNYQILVSNRGVSPSEYSVVLHSAFLEKQ